MTDLFIPLKKTVFTEVDLIHAIVQAYKNMFKASPLIEETGIFWAHFCLECGKGKQCFNWNIGNIKYSKGHNYTMYRCSEILDGKEHFFDPPHPQTWFRSYGSLTEAVQEHLKFLQKDRYKKCLEAAKACDPVLYVKELKNGGYFTAGLDRYTKGVVRIFDEFMAKYQDEVHDEDFDPYED